LYTAFDWTTMAAAMRFAGVLLSVGPAGCAGDGKLEPEMGVRPRKTWIYDGRVGYIPRMALERFIDDVPLPGQ
jgi:hypothetical protein